MRRNTRIVCRLFLNIPNIGKEGGLEMSSFLMGGNIMMMNISARLLAASHSPRKILMEL